MIRFTLVWFIVIKRSSATMAFLFKVTFVDNIIYLSCSFNYVIKASGLGVLIKDSVLNLPLKTCKELRYKCIIILVKACGYLLEVYSIVAYKRLLANSMQFAIGCAFLVNIPKHKVKFPLEQFHVGKYLPSGYLASSRI